MVKRPGEVLTRHEITQLLSAFPETRVGIRDRALCAVAIYAGLRCSEAIALRPEDIDLEMTTVQILHGKGGKRGVAGLNPSVRPFLVAWLEIRNEGEWLFYTRSGKKILPCYFRDLVSRAGKRAGIRHRCHPHACRHTHAVMLAKAGVSVPIISKQLRHSNISTTAVYLDHFAASEVVEAVTAAVW